MTGIQKTLLSLVLFLLISAFYSLTFYHSHISKGSFQTDEPGIVLSTLDKNRSPYSIFLSSANVSQPPLDNLLKEKLFIPLLQLTGVRTEYPELFFRSFSLFWWLLPIAYFLTNQKNFTKKAKITIVLFLFLLPTVEFFRFYLAEARHYSNIGAVMATILIILHSKSKQLPKLKSDFFIITALLPLLHVISYFYYLLTVGAYLLILLNLQRRKFLRKNLDFLLSLIVFNIFIVFMYKEIGAQSSTWIKPSFQNISQPFFINTYFKWTLDWFFYDSPFYSLFKLIPGHMSGYSWLIFFSLVSLFTAYKFAKSLFSQNITNQQILNHSLILLINLVWPISVIFVMYQSGLFQGERYSMAIFITIFFLISKATTEIVWKLNSIKIFTFVPVVLILILVYPTVIKSAPALHQAGITSEHEFLLENESLISDENNIFIFDTGSYASSLSTLSAILLTDFKASYLICRNQKFTSTIDTFNQWLSDNGNENIYLLSSPHEYFSKSDLIWRSEERALYKLSSPLNGQYFCEDRNDPVNNSECYVRCFPGEPLSEDKRSIPGVAPHLDVYRP